MSTVFSRVGLSALFLNLLLATAVRADSVDGERMLTPNQQRRIVQVNQDLPKDIVYQAGDSRKVAELRRLLRERLVAYQQTVKQKGNGTPETHAAAHQVMEAQNDLHKQFIQEEAIPAIASR